MSPPAGVERGVLGLQQQGLVDEERGRRADPEGRERSDLAYRDRSRAGRRHGAAGRSRFPPTSASTSSSFADRARCGGPQDRQLRLRPEKPPVSPEDRKRIDGYMPNELRGELRLQGSPAQRCLGDAALSAQRLGPDQSKHLLGDPEDRPKKFYLGNREYDPVNLGYKYRQDRPTVSSSTPRSAETRTGGTNSGRTTARTRKSRA